MSIAEADDVSIGHSSQSQDDLAVLWSSAVSQTTYKVYQSGLQAFLTFMTMSGFVWKGELPPISEDILLQFVAHCAKRVYLCHSTIKSYLCGVRFMYLRAGIDNPWTTGSLTRLQFIVNSVKRNQGCTVNKRMPITSTVLFKLCKVLDELKVFHPYTCGLLKAVCCLAFFGFLRCGEFTCDQFNHQFHLCVDSVVFDKHHSMFTLLLKSSKTDPFRKGISLSFNRTNTTICPVTSMLYYLSKRNLQGQASQDPLFMTIEGVALSRAVFIEHLKRLLSVAGFDSSSYNGHSFRIGAATSAASSRIPDHLIQVLGRWSSSCYTRYIRTPATVIREAQQAMASLVEL